MNDLVQNDTDSSKAYGALIEGVHIAGYTIERAFKQLEWLLVDDRWQRLGIPFADINAFLDSIKLDNLRIVADQRKRIAEAVRKLQPEASNRAIARMMGVGERTVRRDAANAAPAHQSPNDTATVIPPAAANAALSGTEVAKLAQRAETRGVTQDEKKARRDERERVLAEQTRNAASALGRQIYGVIYADPPWRFEPYSQETGMDRAADNHYQTMTLDDIKALSVPAADDAVLFLWATVPMLPQALDVMAAWGFSYKSHFAWVKDRAGTGYWNRNKHELLLIGTRGSIPAPAPGEQYESVIEAKVQQHSTKPFHFHEIIEEMFPTLPRIELFAREEFVGWDSWGNEAPGAAA